MEVYAIHMSQDEIYKLVLEDNKEIPEIIKKNKGALILNNQFDISKTTFVFKTKQQRENAVKAIEKLGLKVEIDPREAFVDD